MRIENIPIKPLVANLKRINIGRYIMSPDFKILALEHNYDEIWKLAKEQSRDGGNGLYLAFHSIEHHENVYWLILDSLFNNNRAHFFKLLKLTLIDFNRWNKVKTDLSKVIECLEVLEMPNEDLTALKEIQTITMTPNEQLEADIAIALGRLYDAKNNQLMYTELLADASVDDDRLEHIASVLEKRGYAIRVEDRLDLTEDGRETVSKNRLVPLKIINKNAKSAGLSDNELKILWHLNKKRSQNNVDHVLGGMLQITEYDTRQALVSLLEKQYIYEDSNTNQKNEGLRAWKITPNGELKINETQKQLDLEKEEQSKLEKPELYNVYIHNGLTSQTKLGLSINDIKRILEDIKNEEQDTFIDGETIRIYPLDKFKIFNVSKANNKSNKGALKEEIELHGTWGRLKGLELIKLFGIDVTEKFEIIKPKRKEIQIESKILKNIDILTITKESKVFITYSWDNEEHKDWVRTFANKLISNGVDVILDQYEINAGDSFTQFMEKAIEESDKVLVILTPNYKAKSIERKGGVGYEQQIISGEIMAGIERRKFIPIIKNGSLEGGENCCVPPHFKGISAIDFRNDGNISTSMEELLRVIYQTPKFIKPPKGDKPSFLKESTLEQAERPVSDSKPNFKKEITGRINPLIVAKLKPNDTPILTLTNGRTLNAGTIRIEDNHLVHYTGKGLRVIFKPNMTEYEKKIADELLTKSEEYLTENNYIAWTPLDTIFDINRQ